ncbi:MAG: threonylcarbamoyl-AMP synthase [Chitinophagaceae bacterium]|nr:threonylcarbamoyl-AMP synthase [Chitinophagaceae bacterium]
MQNNFEQDVSECFKVLTKGGLILYPTDTIWGIGCDPTNASSVQRIFDLKKRSDKKSMIILVADEREILRYVANADLRIFDYLNQTNRPTTVIYEGAIGLAENLVNEDGTIAIRICKDTFCRHLIKRFQKPIVSTSANISGQSFSGNFSAIADEIKNGVDYIVKYRQDDAVPAAPSSIIKWKNDGQVQVLR